MLSQSWMMYRCAWSPEIIKRRSDGPDFTEPLPSQQQHDEQRLHDRVHHRLAVCGRSRRVSSQRRPKHTKLMAREHAVTTLLRRRAWRLVEHGVPLSQVRDLLGHASIVTTERYDNQKPEALMAAAKRLDTGATFKNLSTLERQSGADRADREPLEGGNSLTGFEEGSGVSDGVRTRDFRSHSPALCH